MAGLVIRTDECEIEAHGIRPVFCYHLIGIHDISPPLAHLATILRENEPDILKSLKWLFVIHHADIK